MPRDIDARICHDTIRHVTFLADIPFIAVWHNICYLLNDS